MDAVATYAHQRLERSLDDSAIRRISIPESFLCADALMLIVDNVISGLVVYPAVINKHMAQELPFMATENIIMALSEVGVSRQDAHEEIRVLCHQAAAAVKMEGKENNLIDRIRRTEFIKPIIGRLDELLEPKIFYGRAPHGGSSNQNPAKANIPGAIAVGQNSQPAAEEDNEADIEEIGEKLKDLIDAIKDAADSGATTTNAAVTTVGSLPASASPCSYALDAYSTCSSVNANFSALPKTQQAGCLCNAYRGFDFNGKMEHCYSFAQNRTQYQTYATAVASGTALCACYPHVVTATDIYGDGNANPCKATVAAATTTPTTTTAPAVTSPTATGAASRVYGTSIAAALLGIMILMALL